LNYTIVLAFVAFKSHSLLSKNRTTKTYPRMRRMMWDNLPFTSQVADVAMAEIFHSCLQVSKWPIIDVAQKAKRLWSKKFFQLQDEQQALEVRLEVHASSNHQTTIK